jgi:hypothetical protein
VAHASVMCKQGAYTTVDAAQELLLSEGELSSVKELAFAFQRAASRLFEVGQDDIPSISHSPKQNGGGRCPAESIWRVIWASGRGRPCARVEVHERWAGNLGGLHVLKPVPTGFWSRNVMIRHHINASYLSDTAG